MVKALFQPLKMAARAGYVIVAWVLVALLVVQVFHAGSAVLVDPGNWGSHVGLGHMLSLPVMLLALLSLIGWMPYRFFLLSLGLFLLIALQYVFLHVPRPVGLPALTALHAVNALVIVFTAFHTGRAAWRFVSEGWQGSGSAPRVALIWVVGLSVLGAAAVGLRPADAPAQAEATEARLPEQYRTMQSPIAPGDEAAIAAGRQIAEKQCIGCHAADFRGKELGGIRSADLTQAAGRRSEQFLMWAISVGSQRGMPAFRSQLSEEQRWQLVAFLKSLKR